MTIEHNTSSSLDLTIGFSSSSSVRELDINQVPRSSVGEDYDQDQELMITASSMDLDDQEEEEEMKNNIINNNKNNTRKKLRLTKQQSRLLEQTFTQHHTLNPKQKEALAVELKLSPRQVEVWFQNRRARSKLKQTEMECEYLKRWFGSLTEQNRRLQREVEELRAMKVGPPTVVSPHTREVLPAATLTMCPRCERITTISSTAAATT